MLAPPERGTRSLETLLGSKHRRDGRGDMLTYGDIQAAKITALQAAYRRKEAETPRDQAPSAGQIRSLGLLDRSAKEVDIDRDGVLPSYGDNTHNLSK